MNARGKFTRRTVLKGTVAGTAVNVGLPLLDCLLNDNGTAMANGAELPPCFGIWFRPLGFTPGRWEPEKIGSGFEMRADLTPLAPFKSRINIFSGMRCFLDSNSNQPHYSGIQISLNGGVIGKAQAGYADAPSLDQLIADVIGARTRFRSLEVACGTLVHERYSRRDGSTMNPYEFSPAALYARIFGPGFKNPNAADFVPDARVMARRSVLSGVSEQSRDFMRQLGTADRTRLDGYFTSLRELEKKLEIELEKPAPLAACTLPAESRESSMGSIIEDVTANHRMFAQLLAHAMACGQTRVINVVWGGTALRRAGSPDNYHTHTHEEAIDQKLGYQPHVTWYQTESLKAFTTMLETLDGIQEGEGTLLDRTLLLQATDVSYGRTHGLDNFPMLTAGSANGRFKTGLHVSAPGDPVTRLGLTLQQAYGVSAGSWGTESNRTSKLFTEILA